MYVDRKPETAKWSHESACRVAEMSLKENVSPWEEQLSITVDATKDKWGERHTTIRITLEEKEIEFLYNRLLQGRKNRLRKLKKVEKELNSHKEKLSNNYDKAEYGSEDEKIWKELTTDVDSILEKI